MNGSESDSLVRRVFKKVGAVVLDSHFVYASGKHGSVYINKRMIYTRPLETSILCREIARQFSSDEVQVVVAPAIGGIILAQWTAYHLTEKNGQDVFSVYAEKSENGQFIIRGDYADLIKGKNIAVLDDILTTGITAKKVIEAVRSLGGKVVGLGVLCNRGDVTPQDVANVPKLIALDNWKLDDYNEADCPLCKDGKEVNTEFGKGREFLLKKSRQK